MIPEDLFRYCYVPYSGEPAIAVVLSRNKSWYPGVRIENISYPLTISAVQCAVFNCLSEGDRPRRLHITGDRTAHLPFWQEEYDLEIEYNAEGDFSDISFQKPEIPADTDIENFLYKQLDKACVANSGFPVSAVVETDLGLFSGVNIECSAWNIGLCAERIALAKAICYGAEELQTLHIHSRSGEFSSPCGACRQVILEHLPLGRIHLYHSDYTRSSFFARDLLPYSFHSKILNTTANQAPDV